MSAGAVIVVVIAVVILLSMILSGRPIWLSLATAGAIGLLVLSGSGITLSSLGSIPYKSVAAYTLVIIPMFILMGILASKAGVAEDVFSVASKLVGWLPGGLGIATILACGGFAAVTGSSVATVATVGKIAIEQMTKHGYRANAAGALVAAGGTLGVLIPPSVILVVYASLTGESIGRLLMAGFIPGVVTMIAYGVFTVILYRRGFFFATSKLASAAERRAAGLSDKPSAGTDFHVGDLSSDEMRKARLTSRNIVGTIYTFSLMFVVMGGMYSGIFTATESGAVAAVIALVMLVVRYAGRWRQLPGAVRESLIETTSLNSMIFALLIGGGIFAYFLVRSGLPTFTANVIVDLNMSPMVIVVVTLIIMIILGAFLDSFSILVITIPLIYPVVDALGVDGIWFGILVVKAIEIGLISPPVGLNVFVVAGSTPEMTPEGIFRGVIPFILAELVTIVVLILFPELVTWLPRVALGG